MHWLGKNWSQVEKELIAQNIAYMTDITYPTGKVIVSGDLRVVRINQAEGKLKFTLLHDRFNK